MKARVRFFARGQSDQARGVPYMPWAPMMRAWPQWARDAYAHGWYSTPLSRKVYPALWEVVEKFVKHKEAAEFKLPEMRGEFVRQYVGETYSVPTTRAAEGFSESSAFRQSIGFVRGGGV